MSAAAPAGFWRRLLAHGLDAMLGACVWALAAMWLLIGLSALHQTPRDLADVGIIAAAVAALALVLHVAYHVLFIGGCGQTPGKMAVGIAVVCREGGPPGYGRAMLRCLGGFLSLAFLGAGYAGVLLTKERRGLADWLAGTRVIEYSPAPMPHAPHESPIGA